ncbi:cation-translocating P-type ATPase [Haloarchaeobius iranensis]|uniref:Ca2+-transporting ATPase n=1 Tax=Haloarchaeobius iranensis TaxID=996166 RepID=A0A1G9UZ53_9EURY|nr:cation-transporting P-type ATPase [Haloarchaeobius iranensis]SDM64915.1 Ca2+-transporting ATPase [Haloarchaeobius iranensis]
MAWHTEDVEAVFEELDSSPDGVDPGEAAQRLAEHGPNEIHTEAARGPLRVFLSQFTSALIWVLLAAAALSLLVGHAVDAVLIAIILLANGIFGFVQEYRAEQSLDALRELSAPEVVVRRGGAERTVPASELVPGDVLVLSEGDVVPADARLVETHSIEVDEAALTGESVPVEKSPGTLPAETPLAERSNTVYRGTSVTRGRAVAVVVETGMETEVGAIATELLTAAETQTPLQRSLDALGRRLGFAVIALAGIVIPVLVYGGTSWVQAGLTGVSLAVAAIPEGLPAIVTLTLALGVRKMADENALVRTLPAVEALGSVDVVCTDKTGTLTEGEMRVQAGWVADETVDLADGSDDGTADTGSAAEPASDGGEVPDTADPVAAAETGDRVGLLLEIGAVCNDATADDGDPTERALVTAAADHGIDVAALREARERVDEISFSAERKRMATVHDDVVYVKGAPGVVLERSTRILTADGPVELDQATRDRVSEQVETFADDALRVLAFAYKDRSDDGDTEENLVLVGLQGLLDPPRREVRDAIADTHRAGIGVKMITGDNAVTAGAIAREVGIESDVMTGSEVAALSDEELQARVEAVDVFARAEPVHKVRILQALQAVGYDVAMTGDGVNDAPALKNADVGIAMGIRGTDVAKQASDIVLLDDNYATIRTAISRGRKIFDNIWKFVAYLLSANAAEVALVFIASLFGYLVLPAVQLLWINLLTDGLPALALGTDPAGDVMDREPRSRTAGIIDREMLTFIGGAGLTVTVVMLGLLVYVLDGAASVTPYAMTMVFTGFVVFEFLKLYVVRWSRGTPLVSNRWLALAVGASLLLHLSVLYTPLSAYFGTVALGLADWGVIGAALLVGLGPLLAVGSLVRRHTGHQEDDDDNDGEGGGLTPEAAG